MVKRYTFLISRGWTEKEKVARRRQAEADLIEDMLAKKVEWREVIANFKYFMTYKAPESLFNPSSKESKEL